MRKDTTPPTKISPESYLKLLMSVQVEEICLTSCSAKFRRDKLGDSLKISTKDAVQFSREEEGVYRVEHS